jgi:hypothetical protein
MGVGSRRDERPEDGWLVGIRGAVRGAVRRGALARIAGNGGRLSELDSTISAIKKASDQVSKVRRSQQYQNFDYCSKIGRDS